MLSLEGFLSDNKLRIANRLKRVTYINFYSRNCNLVTAKVKNYLLFFTFCSKFDKETE